MKRILLLLLLVSVLICVNPLKDESPEKQIKDAGIPALTEEEALNLLLEGAVKCNYLVYQPEWEPAYYVPDEYLDYYYLPPELDSLDKFPVYLSDIFTPETIESFQYTLDLHYYDGRLVAKFLDVSFLLDTETVKIINIEIEGDDATIQTETLLSPVEGELESRERGTYEAKYLEGIGWRLDNIYITSLFSLL